MIHVFLPTKPTLEKKMFPFPSVSFHSNYVTETWEYHGQPGFLRRGNTRTTGDSGLQEHPETKTPWIQARLGNKIIIKPILFTVNFCIFFTLLLYTVKRILNQMYAQYFKLLNVLCSVRSWCTNTKWRLEILRFRRP